MKVIRHYKKTVSEADEIQNGSGNGTSDGLKNPGKNEQKITVINNQIAELLNQRLQKKTQYQQEIKAIETKIVALEKQLADLGENVDASVIEESFKSPVFRRKLYESAMNKHDAMFTSLKLAFDNVEDISYTPSDDRFHSFAKTLVGYINTYDFQDEDDKVGAFKDRVMNMLNKAHISLNNREKNLVVDSLMDVIKNYDELHKLLFV